MKSLKQNPFFAKSPPVLFLAAVLFLTGAAETAMVLLIDMDGSNPYQAVFVLICFGLLILSIAYMIVCSLVSFFFPLKPLPRAAQDRCPTAAILYVVKNEADLEQFLLPSLENSLNAPGIHFWLLSNSDDHRRVTEEERLIEDLSRRFGSAAVHYYRNDTAVNPRGRKHMTIDQWMKRYGGKYRYSLQCDADTTLPEGALSEFLRIAEHPDNAIYAAFQGRLEIRKQSTRYVKHFLLTSSLCQKIYLGATFKVFGTAPLFGHGMLVRNDAFSKLDVPENALSHDIHDAVQLGAAGHRIAFCPEIVTYEEYPANYVESIRRETRWVAGTLQTLPLLLRRGLSAGTRFYVFLPIYNYLMQPLLLLWIVAGFFAETKQFGPTMLYHHYALFGVGSFGVELAPTIFPAVFWVVVHRYAFVGGKRQAVRLTRETLFSTALILNNVIYIFWAVIISPGRLRHWVPMRKTNVPRLGLMEAARFLWPSLVLGIAAVVGGALTATRWLLWAGPFVISFLLAIPLAAYTSGPPATSEAPGSNIDTANRG